MANTMRIMDRTGEKLYLLRRWLFGHRTSKWALMHHTMYLPDEACHHDHPWSFITLILSGGYTEEITREDGSQYTRHNRPGMILWRPATHTHRIASLPRGKATTLVLRFPYQRSWGFYVKRPWIAGKGVWMHWQEHLNDIRNKGINWCGGGEG